MELMEGLLARRSVRRYTNQPVSERDIIDILKAGMYAPSARNQQIWDFVVITDKKLLAGLSERLETAPMAKNAAFAVLVCADTEREKSEGYWEQDCSACIENMMLGALAKGIGSVWIGIHPRTERVNAVRELFGIPDAARPHSLMIAGYPADPLPSADRFHPEFIHMNGWEK